MLASTFSTIKFWFHWNTTGIRLPSFPFYVTEKKLRFMNLIWINSAATF